MRIRKENTESLRAQGLVRVCQNPGAAAKRLAKSVEKTDGSERVWNLSAVRKGFAQVEPLGAGIVLLG